MRRWIATAWHASFLVLAAALYFLFVLPRWFELTGAWPVGLGTPMRIVCGVLIGLCALPVAFTLIQARKPEFGNPQLSLSLRFWSVVLHVLAGVLITGAAVAEIWLSLDSAGQWLFGIYGAAAAIAILGALGFHLAYVAEQAPPPPKPLKPKAPRTRRRGRGATDDTEESTEDATTTAEETVEETTAADDEPDSNAPESDETPTVVAEDAAAEQADDTDGKSADGDDDVVADGETDVTDDTVDADEDADKDEESPGGLRNRRPDGRRRFGRRRGGVAVDE